MWRSDHELFLLKNVKYVEKSLREPSGLCMKFIFVKYIHYIMRQPCELAWNKIGKAIVEQKFSMPLIRLASAGTRLIVDLNWDSLKIIADQSEILCFVLLIVASGLCSLSIKFQRSHNCLKSTLVAETLSNSLLSKHVSKNEFWSSNNPLVNEYCDNILKKLTIFNATIS